MLKIKDDVRLSKLKKYGFRKPEKEYYGKYYEYSNNKGTRLYVFENRKIQITMLEGAMLDHYAALDKIYELIEAGLVEKVKVE